jgi:hypothetical protein
MRIAALTIFVYSVSPGKCNYNALNTSLLIIVLSSAKSADRIIREESEMKFHSTNMNREDDLGLNKKLKSLIYSLKEFR